MSAILKAIKTHYIENLPTEVPTKAAQGFVVTAVINLLYGSASNVALVGGAVAATSTIIEAATRPVIRAIFPENPRIAKFTQIVIPKMMALSLAASAAPWLGVTYKISTILMPLIAWITLNEGFYEKNVGMVEIL
jgi:hypothetical protein